VALSAWVSFRGSVPRLIGRNVFLCAADGKGSTCGGPWAPCSAGPRSTLWPASGGVVPSSAGVDKVGVPVASAAVHGDRRLGAAEQVFGHRTAHRAEPAGNRPGRFPAPWRLLRRVG
jgi:hypothetical protein